MSVSDWSLFAFFTAFALFACYGLGGAFADLGTRVVCGSERSVYRQWGVEEDIFSIQSNLRFGVFFAFLGLGCAYMSYLFVVSVHFVFGEGDKIDFQHDSFERSMAILVMALLIGFLWKMYSIEVLRSKATALKRLPAYFRESLGVADLVATYDSLAHAPKMFWEEFSELNDCELTVDTSKRFQELGSHYRGAKALSYVRSGIIVGVLAALIPVLLFLLQLSRDAFIP